MGRETATVSVSPTQLQFQHISPNYILWSLVGDYILSNTDKHCRVRHVPDNRDVHTACDDHGGLLGFVSVPRRVIQNCS